MLFVAVVKGVDSIEIIFKLKIVIKLTLLVSTLYCKYEICFYSQTEAVQIWKFFGHALFCSVSSSAFPLPTYRSSCLLLACGLPL